MKKCFICEVEIASNRKYCEKCGFDVTREESFMAAEVKRIERYSKLIKEMKEKPKSYDIEFTNTMRSNIRRSESQRIKAKSDFKDLWRDL